MGGLPSFSPLGDMLAGDGADDMHGLMRHKTRGSEMKVVIWRSRVVSKINSPRFHIDRRLFSTRRMVAGAVYTTMTGHCHQCDNEEQLSGSDGK